MSYSVAVRALCEFTAKVGDLDLRFTPSPSAQEGIVGHRTVASRRSAHYQHEVTLEGDYQQLKVRGRADGYDPDANRLEEVKTYRGDLSKQPANHRQLHWAQAKVYGWLMCCKLDLEQINQALQQKALSGDGFQTIEGDGVLINSNMGQVSAYLDDPANSDVFVEVVRYQRQAKAK